MHQKIVPFVVTLLAAAGLSLVPPPAAQADHNYEPAPTGAYRVVQANIGSGSECGGPASGPATDTTQPTPIEDCVGKLKDVIVNFTPDVIIGNEFCQGDVGPFRTWLQARTPDWKVYYTIDIPQKHWEGNLNDPTHKRGCYDANGVVQSKGTILAGKNLHSGVRVQLAPDSNDRQFAMYCATNGSGLATDPTRVCGVHAVARGHEWSEAINSDELYEIQEWQAALGVNARPLIAGDFNRTDDDAKYLRYLDDSLPSAAPGAAKMSDPHYGDVVHVNARTRDGLTIRQQTVKPSTGYLDVPNSTHVFLKVWLKY